MLTNLATPSGVFKLVPINSRATLDIGDTPSSFSIVASTICCALYRPCSSGTAVAKALSFAFCASIVANSVCLSFTALSNSAYAAELGRAASIRA